MHLGFLSEDADVRDHGREHVWPPLYTTGSFDLTTGEGTQTFIRCDGPPLMCSNFEPGSEAPYTAQNLSASIPDIITWNVNVEVDLGGDFGLADSASIFTATRKK